MRSKPKIIGKPTFAEKIIRFMWPIPTSPTPKSKDEESKLRLVPVEAFTKRIGEILYEMTRDSTHELGSYVEFGVYNGTSMKCMLSLLSQMKLDYVHVFGFDSFKGLPENVVSEDGGVFHPGQFSCPREIALQNISDMESKPERASLIEGWYKDTLTRPPSEYGITRASIVLFDCDAYSSARLALRFIYSVLDETCAMIFDDWKLNDLDIREMGEFRAFNEFLSEHPDLSVKSLRGYSRKSKIFMLKKTASVSHSG
ncbi:MAG: TylF/MycF/NovP-related O-methyltransferase [Terracidiphilus sp.]